MSHADAEVLTFTRAFRTSVAELYHAWTEPAMLERWLVPGKNTLVTAASDPRVGGTFRIAMLDERGRPCAFSGSYAAAIPEQVLAMTWRYEGPALDLAQIESVLCVRFRAIGENRAELVLEHARLDRPAAIRAYRSGWESCMQRLRAVLGAEQTPSGFAYDPAHRAAHARYDCVDLAETMAEKVVRSMLSQQDVDFITGRDMLFLATVDDAGTPTVSYKGGAPGFVRAERDELWFPSFDGNGMCISLGNIATRPHVGLLFVDFETPDRLRVHGLATVDDGPAKDAVPGAVCVIRVRPTVVYSNCARYVHRMRREACSTYVPDRHGDAPFPAWKRVDVVFEGLSPSDREHAQQLGAISAEAYAKLLRSGNS